MVDKDLLAREMVLQHNLAPNWHHVQLTSDKIVRLFQDNKCTEFLENYYDSEPDFDEAAAIQTYGKDFWDNPAWKERWQALCRDYEPQRLAFNNWSEPHFEGNWGVTQDEVDDVAYAIMDECMQLEGDEERFYATHSLQDGHPVFYWYGRDLDNKLDYYWSFERRA